MQQCRHLIAAAAMLIATITGCSQHQTRLSPNAASDTILDQPALVSHDLTLPQGTYRDTTPSTDGVYVVEQDNVVINFNDARLVGATRDTPRDKCTGYGIVIRNARNVTIRNAKIEGFKIAIYAENAPGLKIENCDVSCNYRQRLKSTPHQEDCADWLQPHANDKNEWLQYGSGIYLLRCDNAQITSNFARDGQNGICLADCDSVRVERNDMSYMSGWGLAMWRSNHCIVSANRFDYCVRGYSHDVYARGQDSAGILVFEQCCDNIFVKNSATHCGDGFFLYAGHETLKETGEGGCNRNILLHNDFSYAVSIGIEATFSADNCFIRNLMEQCTYGIWTGYSRNSYIAFNNFNTCKTAVAIEHGRDNLIQHNAFDSCSCGIHLWWDEDIDLQSLPYCKKNDCTSARERIWENNLYGCETAIDIDRSTDPSILLNYMRKCGTAIRLRSGTLAARFDGNTVRDGAIINESSDQLAGVQNDIAAETVLTGNISLRRPSTDGGTLDADEMQQVSKVFGEYFALVLSRLMVERPDSASLIMNDVGWTHQTTDTTATMPLGKQHIFITEWGPFNHESGEPCVFPEHVVSWNTATAFVLGSDEAFAMQVVTGDVVASASRDTTPGSITISPRNQGSAATPFAIRIDVGDQSLRLNGVLLKASWQVGYYVCPAHLDPRNDNDWRQVIASPPIHSETRDHLRFNWGNRTPHEKVPTADRFGLVAETKMHLPGGEWRFSTISDDGIRVYVNDALIIDNWTWHIPTEDTGIVSLANGEHTIRVEYFDLVGNAQLSLDLEPVSLKAAESITQ